MPRSFFPEKAPLYAGGPEADKLWLDQWRRNRRSSDLTLSGDETVSGATGDVVDLDVQGDALVLNNATLVTLHGLAVGGDRVQRIPVISIGAGNAIIEHESFLAAVQSRFHTSSGVPLYLLAGKGTALLEYENTSARYRVISHNQGGAITPAFAAGDYTAESGTWTLTAGDVDRYHFTLVGRQLAVDIMLTNTSVSATPAYLRVPIPGGYTAAARQRFVIEVDDNGTPRAGIAEVENTTITFTRLDGGLFAASSNVTDIHAALRFEVSA